MDAQSESSRKSKMEFLALIIAMIYPTIFTWFYFITLENSSTKLQYTTYTLGKLFMVIFPVFWVFFIQREKFKWRTPNKTILILGLVFGISTAVNTVTGYLYIAKPMGLLHGVDFIVKTKMHSLGIDKLWKFLVLGTYYSMWHSLFEEYYWRWFVFSRLKSFLSPVMSIVVSSAAFMSHHVVVLAHFCGWLSPMSIFLSLSVAVGGAVWAGMYHRDGSMRNVWLSHALVDAGIFYTGYLIVYS